MLVRTMSRRFRSTLAAASALAPWLTATLAYAEEGATGIPQPWQMGMQHSVTSFGKEMFAFHNHMLFMIAIICLFVAALLIVVMFRFNEKRNPSPSRTTHHTGLEIAWTIIPVLILVVVTIYSFRLLRDQLTVPKADIVVKATGSSWYWSYEYPGDQGGFKFDSILVQDADLKAGQPRLFTVDNEMVVPVDRVVKLQTTATDVIHSWAVPAFGLKIDAIPGRLNEMWFRAEREGLYHGQCSELCGNGHAYMPITVRVVSDTAYAAWLADARKKYAAIDGPIAVAENR